MAIESVNAATVAASSPQQSSSQQTSQIRQAQQSPEVQDVPKQESRIQESIEENGQITAEQLEAAIERLNELMKDGQRSLAFSVDKELDEVVVRVMDTKTNEIIRQIPNEESLRFAKNLEGVLGVIFNDRA